MVPFFSLVMAIIASLGDVTSGWLLPALFVLKLSSSLEGDEASTRAEDSPVPGRGGGGGWVPLPRWQKAVCYMLVPLGTVLSVAGLTSSIAALVARLRGQD